MQDMTNRTTIEFQCTTGTNEAGDLITETVNAEVVVDGESVQVDLPQGGRRVAIWLGDRATAPRIEPPLRGRKNLVPTESDAAPEFAS